MQYVSKYKPARKPELVMAKFKLFFPPKSIRFEEKTTETTYNKTAVNQPRTKGKKKKNKKQKKQESKIHIRECVCDTK